VPTKELKLQFSGYVIFGSKLFSVLTGFAFQVMVARALLLPTEQYQYNIWFNISDAIAIFTILGGVVPFWVMRYIARGKQGAVKTGIITNLFVAAVISAIYFAMTPLILSVLGISTNFLFIYSIAGLQIVELLMLNVMESCLQAIKPQAVGYGLIIQQVIKLAAGFVLIFLFGLPLLGAVVSILLSFAFQVGFYYSLLLEEMKEKIDWDYVKVWLKSSATTVYNVLGSSLALVLQFALFSFGANANPELIGAKGYYGAASFVAQVIIYSTTLSFALYPKLMAENNHEDITQSLKMVFMFAIPMTVGAIAIADSYMGILNAPLRSAYLVLAVLAANAFVSVIYNIAGSIIYGVENVDREGMNFRKFVKSKIFVAFSLPYLQGAISLPISYYLLTTYLYHKPLEAALYVGVIILAANIITTIFLISVLKKVVRFGIPWRNISKFVAASAVMGAVMFVVPHPEKITTTLGMTAVGALIYIGLLTAIDQETRALIKTILRAIIGLFKHGKLVFD
jgi:O-antigen/teichoic acid export membrane protein